MLKLGIAKAKSTAPSMLVSIFLKSCGWILGKITIEDLLVHGLWTCSFFVFASGGYEVGTACTILVWILQKYIRGLETVYTSTGYGRWESQKLGALGSPAQLSRGDVDCGTDRWLRDKAGRRVILRGVNVSGSSKFPRQCGTHIVDGFYDTKNISFVGRPFLLSEAKEHFCRIQACGLTLVRLLVPWEAVEHKGLGEYDEEYLDYLLRIVRIANECNIACIIDPHQDVWSRWTGGDGAPAWTLEAAGFNIEKLHASGAAFTQQGHLMELGDGAALPCMHWPSNHHRLAAVTMFTLFFGGNDFCPQLMVQGKNIQDFLQQHYFAAFAKVAETLANEPNVLGFDTLNEPYLGMIGCEDLAAQSVFMRQGPSPTFFESFQLGDGATKSVHNYFPSLVKNGSTVLNPRGVRAWTGRCIWEAHGVWGKVVASGPFTKQKNATPEAVLVPKWTAWAKCCTLLRGSSGTGTARLEQDLQSVLQKGQLLPSRDTAVLLKRDYFAHRTVEGKKRRVRPEQGRDA